MDTKISTMAAGYLQLIPQLYRKLDASGAGTAGRRPSTGLTHLQVHVLEEMYQREEGIAMSDLARTILVSKQQLTPLITRLEQKQYVRREADAADKRSVRLTLTEKGRALVYERWAGLHGTLCRKLEGLGEEDQADLEYVLVKLSRILSRLE
ncbi:MarR family transcriptional regulator [Paenibacillus aurantius]|uniref:MarR family transcriptional regulator n=1 Tax=Paenibacillus aurantius TaxID=2918900 RepID=A0AA96LG08_9BACL|nr:MarR family transcriptional regulator [Paenibacillus aurantius]WNQ12348.1 MarR family transcriptional regulator [Paenibacillus aurantius]